MHYLVALVSVYLVVVCGQQVGMQMEETHPNLSIQQCAAGGNCQTLSTSVTIDANWRSLHTTSGTADCYAGTWNTSVCPDPVTCAKNCALDGANYTGSYGITSTGSALTIKLVTHDLNSTNVGSRMYLMANDTNYQMFNLQNQEFAFDVDVSNLPCGLNGALYFVQMDPDGGLSKYPNNKAGAKYGTGYCDAQCAKGPKFINGEGRSHFANIQGSYGSCCSEMDIWEANAYATVYTPHVCTVQCQTRCSGSDCGSSGVCDESGCGFNSYRMGDTSFFGMGKIVDTSSKFTVVTQFITEDNTTAGALTEIRRVYMQNGKVIQNSKVNISGIEAYDSITDPFCNEQMTTFNNTNSFETRGGLKRMGQAFDEGMVLVLSLWDDHSANMLWLDSDYPVNKSASLPGVARGPCAATSGVPADVESQSPNSSVTFSNIKFGDIGSTCAISTH